MNIRAHLLGFFAASFAVSSAHGADALLVEPEPMEYMRICDAYGAGFFYIPGTETCLSLNGYIRTTYTHYKKTTGGIEDPDHASWGYRGRWNVDVRNETEWGTLRSQLRLQGNGDGGDDANVGLDRALISVAGFRLGYSDTYWETAHGSGADSPAIADGMYNSDQGLFFDYTAAFSGLALTVGVQDSSGTNADMEAPDYYVGAKYSGSWGWLAATYLYDQNGTDAATAVASGADAWKVSFRLENLADSGWSLGGWYMADGNDATSYVTGDYGAAGALVDNEWGVVLDGAITNDLTGYLLYSEAEGIGSSATYLDTQHLAAGLIWEALDGLKLQTEYFTNESDYVLAASDTDTEGFIVRVVRSW